MQENLLQSQKQQFPTLHLANFKSKAKQNNNDNTSQPQLSSNWNNESQQQGKQAAHAQSLYTVAQSLKDEYVYKNLNLDLGSLPEFLNLDGSSSLPVLNHKQKQKKKKQHDDSEEDKDLFYKQKPKYYTPLDILKYEDDEKQRAMAAKQLVSQLFKNNFKEDIEKFEENNSLNVLQKKYLQEEIDPDNPIYKIPKKLRNKSMEDKITELQNLMANQNYNVIKDQKDDKKVKNKSDESAQSPKHSINVSKQQQQKNEKIKAFQIPSSQNDKQQDKDNLLQQKKEDHAIRLTQLAKLEIIFNIRIKYNDVQTIWKAYAGEKEGTRQEHDQLFKDYIENHKKFVQNYYKKIQQYEYWQEKQFTISYMDQDYEQFQREFNEIPRDEVFIYEDTQISIWNQKLDPTIIFYISLNYPNFYNLQRLDLIKNGIKEDSLIILLEILFREGSQINYIDLSMNKGGLRVAQTLQKIVEKRPIKTLKLRGMDLTTKQFCIISLGIAQNAIIEEVNVSQNQLDDRSIKTLETLLRYVKNLKRVDISSNPIKPQMQKELRKSFKFNENAKDKEIKI